MTDNEIIKALECCIEDEDCSHCPSIKEMPYCSNDIMVGALNLINRQQTEIERLKNKIKIECNPYCKPTFGYDSGIAIMRYIDNLVKEKVNNEKGESKAMNKIFYLFIFADNSIYEVNNAVSFKYAMLKMAEYTGNSSDMFCKCLNAYKNDEIDGIIELFNHFCYYDKISKVYVIDRKIFDDKE